MAEQDTDFLEIGLAQLGQYFRLDGVVAKCLGVSLETQLPATSRQCPRRLPSADGDTKGSIDQSVRLILIR